MSDLEWVIAVIFFGCFGAPFVIIGLGIVIFPHKAIDNAVEIAKRFPGYEPTDYPDPHGTRSVVTYRLFGVMFALMGICPFLGVLNSGL